jgi:hypothetical protein
MRKQQFLPTLVALVALVLVISACGGSSQTAGQVILNSGTAMKQIKTAHLDMKMTENVSVTGPSSSSSGTSTSTTLTANGHGDTELPDQTSISLSLGGIDSYTLAVITQGQQVYIQNQHGQWYVIDKSKLTGTTGSTLTSTTIPDFNKLLDLATKNAQVADHGDKTLNGASLRHVTVSLDKNGFEQLVQGSGQLQGLTSQNQQALNDLFNSAQNLSATLDFWINESTNYLHRFEMQYNIALDLSKIATPTSQGKSTGPTHVSIKLDMTVDLSKFNDSSIKITPPANATPTDHPSVVFSGQSPTPSPTITPGLTVYAGNGYSIGYPQGWKVTPSGNEAVTFSDETTGYALTIVVFPNPNGITDASTVVKTDIESNKKTMQNPQTETLPPTTTVGGDRWVQQSISGTETSNGESFDVQLVVISDDHPAHSANTQNFTVIYTTDKSSFATANTSYFQPMLHSFTFT